MTSTQSSPRPDGKPEGKQKSAEAVPSQVEPQPAADASPDQDAGQEASGSAGARPTSAMSATLRYTLMRLCLFVATFVVLAALAWVGVIPAGIGTSNPLWLFALAILVSAPLSLVLLRKQRDAMSEQIVPKVERASSSFKGRLAENRAREDDA